MQLEVCILFVAVTLVAKTHALPTGDDSVTEGAKKVFISGVSFSDGSFLGNVTVTENEEKFETPDANVIFDFHKNLGVVMVKGTSDHRGCYLMPFETKHVGLDSYRTNQNYTKTQKFQATDIAIQNNDFLSPLAKEDCAGIDTYWMVPDLSKDAKPSREKRRGFLTKSWSLTINLGFFKFTIGRQRTEMLE